MDRTVSFLGPYVRRIIDDELDALFDELPAILLDGPKGVGKTETAKQRARTVRRLDVTPERAVVEATEADAVDGFEHFGGEHGISRSLLATVPRSSRTSWSQ